MRIAIVAFDGFDELDVFITLGLLNRVTALEWKAEVASPAVQVTSMNGVTVQAQRPLEFANEAGAVVFAGGLYNRAIGDPASETGALLDRLQLDPLSQSIGALSSGSLLLARLGLLGDMPACTDAATKPWLVAAGVRVEDAPFHARGPIATAGGSLAATYLAAWVIAKRAGWQAAGDALRLAAPVAEHERFVEQVFGVVRPFVEG